jgi:hypothetical protein
VECFLDAGIAISPTEVLARTGGEALSRSLWLQIRGGESFQRKLVNSF